MKNIIFLILVIATVSCKKKDEVKPETKSANLHIEFTATSSSSMSMTYDLKSQNRVIWTKLSNPSTSFALVKDTVLSGDQAIQFVSRYTSSSITNAHIKITFNNVIYCDDDLTDNGTSVSKTVILPFIN